MLLSKLIIQYEYHTTDVSKLQTRQRKAGSQASDVDKIRFLLITNILKNNYSYFRCRTDFNKIVLN